MIFGFSTGTAFSGGFEKPGVCRESGEARWLWAGKNRRNFIFIKEGIRWEQLCVNYMCSGRGDSREKPWRAPGSEGGSEWRVTGMQREVKAVGGRSPGLDGEADRTGTLLPPLQGKPDNGGNRYHPVKYGGSSGGGRGGIPCLRVWKKVFSRVYLP